MSDCVCVELEDVAQELQAHIIPQIHRCTVPICAYQNDQLVYNRTGVLYRISGTHFVLTASHVPPSNDLRALMRYDIPLFIPGADTPGTGVPLVDAVFHGTEVDGRDVAAIELSPTGAKDIAADHDFVAHASIDSNDDGLGLYLVFGYPCAWVAVDAMSLEVTPMINIGRRYEGHLAPRSNADPNVHLLVRFDRGTTTLTGERVLLPKLAGMSGCGVWRVGDRPNRRKTWTPIEPRLVAIENASPNRVKDNYIKATRVQHVMQLILDKYPGLYRPMSLVYKH